MPGITRKLWLSMLGIGTLVGMVFVYKHHWTPSGLLKAMSWSIWQGDDTQWPADERFTLIATLLLGIFTAVLATQSFKLKGFTSKGIIKHLFAGILMGGGAVMARGGNDTQLLVAMPALSLAGLSTVVCIIVGIYVGIQLPQYKWLQ